MGFAPLKTILNILDLEAVFTMCACTISFLVFAFCSRTLLTWNNANFQTKKIITLRLQTEVIICCDPSYTEAAVEKAGKPASV